jgi:GWxTD domain-containing protein
LVRDPTPGTAENEMKEEHYRRIAYTNEHFSTAVGLPGWKTDRGRIYISFGPPDEIDSHPSGGNYQRPAEEGGGSISTVPFEQWRYRFIENVGQNVVIEFVDPARTGEYRMTMDLSEKDVLGAANARQATEFQAIPAAPLGGGRGSANLAKAGTTVQLVGNNGVQMSIPLDRYGDHQVNLYVRLTNSEGRVVKVFEQTVHGQITFSQFLALTPGSYHLNVVLKDLNAAATAGDSIAFEVK